jgi:hypothetical protein
MFILCCIPKSFSSLSVASDTASLLSALGIRSYLPSFDPIVSRRISWLTAIAFRWVAVHAYVVGFTGNLYIYESPVICPALALGVHIYLIVEIRNYHFTVSYTHPILYETGLSWTLPGLLNGAKYREIVIVIRLKNIFR